MQDKLRFRIRIARCLLKSGDIPGAVQSYRMVLSEDNDRFLGEEVPYQFLASFQLAQILGQNGRPDQAFDILAGLYGKMVHNFRFLEQQQFMYYLSRVREELQKYLQEVVSKDKVSVNLFFCTPCIYLLYSVMIPLRVPSLNSSVNFTGIYLPSFVNQMVMASEVRKK